MARYNSKNFTRFITGGFLGPKKPSCRWWTPLKITFIGARIWRWITTLKLLEEVSPLSASHWTVSCRAMRRLTATWSLCGKTGDEIFFFSIVGSLRKDCPGALGEVRLFAFEKTQKQKVIRILSSFVLWLQVLEGFFLGPCLRKSSPQPEDQTGSTTCFPGGSSGIRMAASKQHAQVYTSDLAMISFIRLDQRGSMGWWFQIFFVFTPIWGRFPFWLIFFKRVETTN